MSVSRLIMLLMVLGSAGVVHGSALLKSADTSCRQADTVPHVSWDMQGVAGGTELQPLQSASGAVPRCLPGASGCLQNRRTSWQCTHRRHVSQCPEK